MVLLSLFMQCTVQFTVMALFEIEKDYIVAQLCENRDKPQMNCCGKCYLNKQIKKVTNEQPAGGIRTVKVEKEALVYIVPVVFSSGLTINYVTILQHQVRYCMMSSQPFIPDIFHPPGIFC